VETVKGSVEALCTKVFTLSVEHVKKIRERHVLLLKENGLNDPTPAVPPGHRKEEICSPIQFALPPIRLPVVDYQFERDHINVKYTHPSAQQPDTHTLNMTHLQKLVSADSADESSETFSYRILLDSRNNFTVTTATITFPSSSLGCTACLSATRRSWETTRRSSRSRKSRKPRYPPRSSTA
jgi:hypothetical protein